MDTLFDYLKWRGDITFLENSLNEVDGLIFCAFSYIKLENLVDYKEKISIKDMYEKYKNIEETSIFKENQNLLFKMLSESKRFQSCLITHYFNEVNEAKAMQISGLTFILPNETLFVAFRGTDSSLTGWKEDFELSFKKAIPSQIRATKYLDEILFHTNKKVYVGGHSKGGNLAMYASIFCKKCDNLLQIYNYDGPGFSKDILNSKEYQKLKNKIVTFIPKASIVGNLFYEDVLTVIVKSKQFGVLQHDLYSWLVMNNHFLYVKELNEETKKLSNLLNETLDKIPNSVKEKITTILFELLDFGKIEDIEKEINHYISTSILKYHLKKEDFVILRELLPIVIEIMKKEWS